MNTEIKDKFQEVNQANLELLLSLAGRAFTNAERFASLNLSLTRDALEDFSALNNYLDKKPRQGIDPAAALTTLEKAIAYSRSVHQLATDTQQELADHYETKLADTNKYIATCLKVAAEKSPEASSVYFETWNAALKSAQVAYQRIKETTQQVAEIAATNIQTATEQAEKIARTNPP